MPENNAIAEKPRDSDVGYAKLMDAFKVTSAWCGAPLGLLTDLFDALKKLRDERGYADLRIEVKAGKPFRFTESQTRQYSNEP